MSKKLTLTIFEKQYLNLFGDLYEKRGFPKALGQIYALLALKANTPEDGLVQQDIAKLIDRSVSAVSRLLTKLAEMKYCEYVEVINPNKKRERKYYMRLSMKDIALRRINLIIDENDELKNSLNLIIDKIGSQEKKEQAEFIDFIKSMSLQIVKLRAFYEKTIDTGKELL